MADAVASWDIECRFSKTNLSDRLSLDATFTKTRFAEQLADTFTRLSSLEPIIEEGLTQL
ncbi:hypothetical protein [Candidatus Leptofilum sp.]|uniref:hypothetical protein n=1 Tax=Candidatus Leptofilum sp. TaxID=3241576 RepID=UPI003B5C5DD5